MGRRQKLFKPITDESSASQYMGIKEFKNKIICGDCLKILPKIPDNSVDLIITDPPYNISQKGKSISRKSMRATSMKRNMDIKLDFGDWDHMSEKNFKKFTEEWFKECARILKPKSWIYVFFSKERIGYLAMNLDLKYGLKTRTIFTWVKKNPAPQFKKVNWISATEFIWVGSKGASKLKNYGYVKDMYNWYMTCNKSIYGKTEHPTEKPVELVEHFIRYNSNENDIVLDPFLGSGTTAVACKRLRRNYLGIEKNKKYCRIAKQRIDAQTLPLF